MACNHCTATKKIPDGTTYGLVDIHVRRAGLRLEYQAYSVDSSFDIVIPIKFCPMCGRKLTQSEET
jgi:hypothetical protein